MQAADSRHRETRTAVESGAGAGAQSDPSADVAEAQQVHHPASYPQSLVYSGLLGLVISVTGLGMVMARRRLW